MAKRPITDELLNLATESKLDAGVPFERIRVLVEAFAGDHTEADQPDPIVGFLAIEDIPASRRADFLKAVLALNPEPNTAAEDARHDEPQRAPFAVSLLMRATAALRFTSA
jgi:hypothetical protein